jgi:hypothetical protein
MRVPPSIVHAAAALLLLLPLGLVVPASAAARRALASTSSSSSRGGGGGGGLEAWPPEGLFLPPELTERDVLVDGLLPGAEEDPQKPGEDDDAGGAADANGDQGAVGRIFSALLARARAQERATPNVGGSANAFTRVEGARTAQRRNATVVLSSGPLNAAALSTAGGAAVAPAGTGLARADARAGASTFANAILSDANDDPKDFAAAGSSRGSTVAASGGGGGTTRAAGAQTVLGASSAAGEQAAQGRAGLGIGPFLVLFNLGSRDGAQENGGAGSVGIGDKASTRLQVASLAEGRKSEQRAELDEPPPPPPPPPKPEHKEGREEEEEERDASAAAADQARPAGQLRTSAPSPPPPPPPDSKPPGPYARATARKRDALASKAARRKEKQAGKDGARPPQDAAIVEGALTGRCDGEDDGGGGSSSKEGAGESCGKGGGAPYRGGSALRAWADSADAPGLSTTGAGIADANVRAGLSSEGAANRYGYSRGISTGSAAATGTKAARARVASLSFGTGYVVKSTAATARAVERSESEEEEEEDKHDDEKDGGRRRRR